jgi:hypothetical protein
MSLKILTGNYFHKYAHSVNHSMSREINLKKKGNNKYLSHQRVKKNEYQRFSWLSMIYN